MNYDEMCQAVAAGKRTISLGDIAVRSLAKLLVGRLKIAKVPGDVLAELKRELRDFNINTNSWKGK